MSDARGPPVLSVDGPDLLLSALSSAQMRIRIRTAKGRTLETRPDETTSGPLARGLPTVVPGLLAVGVLWVHPWYSNSHDSGVNRGYTVPADWVPVSVGTHTHGSLHKGVDGRAPTPWTFHPALRHTGVDEDVQSYLQSLQELSLVQKPL